MKRYQIKNHNVEEVEWLDKDGNVISRCCKECGSDYLTEDDIRKEIASRVRQLGNEIESSSETWSTLEVMSNTKIMYSTLIYAISEEGKK